MTYSRTDIYQSSKADKRAFRIGAFIVLVMTFASAAYTIIAIVNSNNALYPLLATGILIAVPALLSLTLKWNVSRFLLMSMAAMTLVSAIALAFNWEVMGIFLGFWAMSLTGGMSYAMYSESKTTR